MRTCFIENDENIVLYLYNRGNGQWALELSSHVWWSERNDPEARLIRAEAMVMVAGLQVKVF